MSLSEYRHIHIYLLMLVKMVDIEAVEAQEWMLFDSWIPCDYFDYFAKHECVAMGS